MDAPALTVNSDSGLLGPGSISVDEVRDNEVLVRVTHCGVCRSDLARIAAPPPESTAPIVPGHEIVGEVVQLGRDVSGLSVGTRVGIGWQSGSCGRCEWCLSGQEHLCADQEETCIGRSGGFAARIKVQSRFAVPVPEGLDSVHAAPLLCAGVTVFSPMLRHRLRAGQRTAVVGIGGLGHLALQFLRALGCIPDAFSTSPLKARDARAFGGLPRAHVTFAADELIGFQKTIEGSPIGSPETIAEMFRFAADRNVRPSVECFPMTQGNTALKRLAARQIRYRAVLLQDWN